MPKEKKKKSTIKNNEPKFQINQNLLENRGVSFQYMIASRLQEGNTLGEAIFKTFLLNKNKPLTLRQLQSILTDAWVDVLHLKNLSDEVLLNWLGADNQYCVNQILSD